MTETPLFFSSTEVRLFGMIHSPEHPESKTAFLMCHPFAEEKLWSHRVLTSFARALADRGHTVLRFDFTAAGDSSGTQGETGIAGYVADTAAACDQLLSLNPTIERIGLIGLRLGATVAALFAEQSSVGSRSPLIAGAPLILWEPIVNGDNYVQELLRINLATQLAVDGRITRDREALRQQLAHGLSVNVDGYELGMPLYEALIHNTLLPGTKQHGGPTLVVQITASEGQDERAELRDTANSYHAGTFIRAVEQPFWREIRPFYGRAENLQLTTLQWCDHVHV